LRKPCRRVYAQEEGLLQKRAGWLGSGGYANPDPVAGFTLKKKDFFKNAPAIALFAVAGTLISTLVFGLLTYFLLAIRVVRRSALGPAPLTECMLYGAAAAGMQAAAAGLRVLSSCMHVPIATTDLLPQRWRPSLSPWIYLKLCRRWRLAHGMPFCDLPSCMRCSLATSHGRGTGGRWAT
jgi:hypothetical protein